MPIKNLSTELDSHIASFLVGDTQTLSAFSKVSKYYRSVVTESYLYKKMSFSGSMEIAMKQLLLTLVNREELALHITSVQLRSSEHYPTSRATVDESMWTHANKIHAKINDIAAGAHGVVGSIGFAQQWLSNLFTSNPYTVDAASALILCMAINIEHIDLDDNGSFKMTRDVMETSWKGSDAYRFKALTEVTIGGYSGVERAVTLLPAMKTLRVHCTAGGRIQDGRLGRFTSATPSEAFLYPAPRPVNASLHTLTFFGMHNLTARFVAQMVSSTGLVSLKKLAIQRCGNYTRASPEDHDLPALVRALEQHLPGLEVFDFRRIIHPKFIPPFDTFKNLKQLRELGVDYELLIPEGHVHLVLISDPYAMFPESLEQLMLDGIPKAKVKHFSYAFHANIGKVENLPKSVSQALAHLSSKFPLKRLKLGLDFMAYEGAPPKLELRPKDVLFLRYAADEFAKIGRDLEVHRMPGSFITSYKLLVKSGFTAPLPHSFVLEERKRSCGGDRAVSV